MIQYDRDGVTLFYVDANGKRVSHNYMEGAAYDDMLNVRTAQIQAARENTQAVANYETTLSNVQISVDAGHAMDAPAKPPMKVVGDDGVVTFIPFDPPLKDLVAAAVGRPAPPSQISTGAPAAALKSDILFNMVQAIFRKMFPEAQ